MALKVVLDRRFHCLRVIPGLHGDYDSIGAYQVSDIWRRAIGAPDRVVHFIHQHQAGYAFVGGRLSGEGDSIFICLRLGNRVSFLVPAESFRPLFIGVRAVRTGGVSVYDVNNDDVYLVAVPGLEFFRIGARPTER